MLLIGSLEAGPRRFGQLRDQVDGISEKMLTQTLRSLERDGLVTRTASPAVPPSVTYELTDLGRSLSEPMASVRAWAERYINDVERSREAADAVSGLQQPTR
ncbi:winged helix-turn-helix transcriptional regulator [Streptomyces sp. NBC_01198]|uniref:winged helix-turn-helix transcriptional regulator n=1 Tax=Streptomyces sp. NBC_01198 TaxID=2903769 RepID=UPI003FA3A903